MPEVYRVRGGPAGRSYRKGFGRVLVSPATSPSFSINSNPQHFPESCGPGPVSMIGILDRFPGAVSTLITLVTCAVCLLAFAAEAGAVPVKFQWNASSGQVAGYKLYQGTQSGKYLSSATFPGTATTATMDLDPAASRYVAATAYDSSQRESAFSNEILCHPVVASAATGGTLSPSGTFFAQNGGSVTFTLIPNSGYRVSALTVNGNSVGTATSYTLTGITAKTTVVATFEPVPAGSFTITVTAPTNGTISPSGTVTVAAGGSRTFTITPSTGYTIQDVRVDGSSVGAVSTYTFTNVQSNRTLSATFAVKTYTIAVSTPTNGTISPSGNVSVTHGSSRTFTITPSTGYAIDRVLVDGASVGAPASYTFTNVTAAHTLSAQFTSKTNKPPVADAGPDQTVQEGRTVTLNGSGSNDPDDGIASYSWTRVSGPTVTLSNAAAASPTFTAPDVGPSGAALTFRLTVTDKSGATATDTCIVNVTWVNQAPTANAGPTLSVAGGATVPLDGSGSTDPDDGIASYRWVKKTGPTITLTNSSSAVANFVAPIVGPEGASFTFELTVTDKGGLKATAQKTVTVTWVNAPPKANAGPDRTVTQGEAVTLDGSASTDPDDGIRRYRWTQTSGPPATWLSGTSSAVAAFTAPEVDAAGAELTFRLTVTDNGGLQNTDTCVISVRDLMGPDLTGAWKSFTYSGSTASGSLEVRNAGNLSAARAYVAFYLSTDGSTLGRLITRKVTSALAAGQAQTLSFSYRSSTLKGQYIVAVVDYLERIKETSETNNRAPVVVP